MAKGIRVVLSGRGVRDLLRSKEMLDICTEAASTAVQRLGDGYEVTSRTGKTRVNASVAAASVKAKRENAKHNTILKALK